MHGRLRGNRVRQNNGEQPSLPILMNGVPATAVWALYHRSPQMDDDPMADHVLGKLDFPLDSYFGRRIRLMSHYFAARARLFDREIAGFLGRHPAGTVIALGEGLDTQFWRVDNGQVRWLTVDFPDMVELRTRLLPHTDRQQTASCSVLDPAWMDRVESPEPVLIVAQGLFAYLRPGEVTRLIGACADRFPGGSLMFDTQPRWFTGLARLGVLRSGRFRLPPMYFGMSPVGLRRLGGARRRLENVRYLPPDRRRGPLGYALSRGHRTPLARRTMPATVWADFRPAA